MPTRNDRPHVVIEGPGLILANENGLTILAGFGTNAVVTGGNENTTLLGIGGGDITAYLGDGRNLAIGGNGNDTFFGGAGSNKLFGGAGNDLLVRGEGYNEMRGGSGSDIIAFGQWDQVYGGSGPDWFISAMKAQPPGPTFVNDLNFGEGDRLDLTYMPEVTRTNLSVHDDTLSIALPGGGVQDIVGVGHQIHLVGGIDAAVNAGYLSVFGDYGTRG